MDGENNGKPYFFMDDLGGKPPIFGKESISIRALHKNQSHQVVSYPHFQGQATNALNAALSITTLTW